jgi:hypothetical protein
MEEPNMTTAPDNPSPEASSGPESQPAHLKLFEPIPSGFEPEYDYLATLRALSEAKGLDAATGVVLAWMNELRDWNRDAVMTEWLPRPRACIIDSTGPIDCLTELPRDPSSTEQDRTDWLYREILKIRRTMKTEAQQRTCVLTC